MKKKITVLYGPAESGKSLLINHLIPEAGPHWRVSKTEHFKQYLKKAFLQYYLDSNCNKIVIDECDYNRCEKFRKIWNDPTNKRLAEHFSLIFLSQDPEVLTLQPDFYTIFKISH